MPNFHGLDVWLLRAVLAGGGLALAMLWENRRGFQGPSLPRRRHEVTNLSLWLTNAVILQVLFGVGAFGAAVWAQQRSFGLLHQLGWGSIPAAFSTILLLDLLTYALHRLYHASPLLWRIHRVHHSDVDLRVTTGVRFHPIEVCLSTAVRIPFVVGMGLHPVGVVFFEASLLLASQIQHADVCLGHRIDRVLRAMFVTPNLHRVHHSQNRVEADSNFGTILTLWDRIFRTYRRRADLTGFDVGLPDGGAAPACSLATLWRMPFRDPSADARPGVRPGFRKDRDSRSEPSTNHAPHWSPSRSSRGASSEPLVTSAERCARKPGKPSRAPISPSRSC